MRCACGERLPHDHTGIIGTGDSDSYVRHSSSCHSSSLISPPSHMTGDKPVTSDQPRELMTKGLNQGCSSEGGDHNCKAR